MFTRIALVVSLTAVGLATATIARRLDVPYPDGFRRWTHIKSELTAPRNDADTRAGIHHIYANPLALGGYESGQFPDGSVIVFDLLAVTTDGGVTKESTRKLIDVMRKDSTRFATTGGWGFEEFAGDSRTGVLGDRATGACFQCHTQRKDSDFVFSAFRP